MARDHETCLLVHHVVSRPQSRSGVLFYELGTADSETTTGSLLFCPDCGTLLSLPRDGETMVACEQCGREEPAGCEPISDVIYYKVLIGTDDCSIRECYYHDAL
jgi:hypothetical protein